MLINNQKESADINEQQYSSRAPRFPSHALIDVRLSKWNPFSKCSAVLLDMSVTGFKIQFVDPVEIKPNTRFAIIVPLEPFGILGGGRLYLRAEMRWYDADIKRAGGVFFNCTDHERLMIERILASVISRQ